MQRAVLIKAIDTPFQWITTSVEEATDFTTFLEKRGYMINTDPHAYWPEKIGILPAYDFATAMKVQYYKEQNAPF